MKQVQILGTDGNKYRCSDNILRTAINNAEHRSGSVAWCDGDFLLGGQQYSSRVPYVPAEKMKVFLNMDSEHNYQFLKFNDNLDIEMVNEKTATLLKDTMFVYNQEVMFSIKMIADIFSVSKFNIKGELLNTFNITLPCDYVEILKFDINDDGKLIGEYHYVGEVEQEDLKYKILFISSIDDVVDVDDHSNEFNNVLEQIKDQFEIDFTDFVDTIRSSKVVFSRENSINEVNTSSAAYIYDTFKPSGIHADGFSNIDIPFIEFSNLKYANNERKVYVSVKNIQLNLAERTFSFNVDCTPSGVAIEYIIRRLESYSANMYWIDSTSLPSSNISRIIAKRDSIDINDFHGITFNSSYQYSNGNTTLLSSEQLFDFRFVDSGVSGVAINSAYDNPVPYLSNNGPAWNSVTYRWIVEYSKEISDDVISLNINKSIKNDKKDITEKRNLNNGYSIERTGDIKKQTSRCFLKHNDFNILQLSAASFGYDDTNNSGEFPEKILDNYPQIFVEETQDEKNIMLFVGHGSSLLYTAIEGGETKKIDSIGGSINYRMPIIKISKSKMKLLFSA